MNKLCNMIEKFTLNTLIVVTPLVIIEQICIAVGRFLAQ
jgi:hypothetical protein